MLAKQEVRADNGHTTRTTQSEKDVATTPDISQLQQGIITGHPTDKGQKIVNENYLREKKNHKEQKQHLHTNLQLARFVATWKI